MGHMHPEGNLCGLGLLNVSRSDKAVGTLQGFGFCSRKHLTQGLGS